MPHNPKEQEILFRKICLILGAHMAQNLGQELIPVLSMTMIYTDYFSLESITKLHLMEK